MWPFSRRRQTIARKFGLTNSFASKSNSDPASQLCGEILDASLVCAIQLAAGLSKPSLLESGFALASEFAAAFTALALNLMLLREHRETLRAKLLFLFPEEVKEKFIKREQEFLTCSQLFVADKPLSGDGIVNRMSLHVAEACGSSFNPEVLRQSAVVFASVSRELNLRRLALACVPPAG